MKGRLHKNAVRDTRMLSVGEIAAALARKFPEANKPWPPSPLPTEEEIRARLAHSQMKVEAAAEKRRRRAIRDLLNCNYDPGMYQTIDWQEMRR